MSVRYALLFALVASTAQASSADDVASFAARNLKVVCDSYPAGATAAYCLGYISGYVDGMSVESVRTGVNRYCAPETGATYDQYVLIVQKWLKDHPEKLHTPKMMAIEQALADAFPCE